MRVISEATLVRRLKAQANRTAKYTQSLEAEIRERRRYGGMLANIAFNLAQLNGTPVEHKAVLDECRKAWDEIKRVPLEGK